MNEMISHMYIWFIIFQTIVSPQEIQTHTHARTRFTFPRRQPLYPSAPFLHVYRHFSRSAHARIKQQLQCCPKISRQTDSSRAGRSHFDARQRRRSDAPVKLLRKKGDTSPSHLLSLPLHRFLSHSNTPLSPRLPTPPKRR